MYSARLLSRRHHRLTISANLASTAALLPVTQPLPAFMVGHATIRCMRFHFSRAFSLVELGSVLAIIGILAVIGFVSFNFMVADSQDIQAVAALRATLTTAVALYASDCPVEPPANAIACLNLFEPAYTFTQGPSTSPNVVSIWTGNPPVATALADSNTCWVMSVNGRALTFARFESSQAWPCEATSVVQSSITGPSPDQPSVPVQQ